MLEATYVVHGVGMQVATDSAELAAAADALLGAFRREAPARAGPASLHVRISTVASPADVPPALRRVAARVRARGRAHAGPRAAPWYELVVHERLLVADFGWLGLLVVDYARGTVEGCCVEAAAAVPDALPYLCFFAVSELLKRDGLTAIHAGAVEREGRGVLVPAPSGHGKTTTCIALLRAGFRSLSDDHPLLRTGDGALELLAFPTPWRVTDHTIALFPELAAARPTRLTRAPGAPKHSFHVHDVYGRRPAGACRPALVLLPRIVDAWDCRVEPIAPSETLRALLPCAMLVADRATCERQFAMLGALAAAVDGYRLLLGRCVDGLPDLVASLLPRAAGPRRAARPPHPELAPCPTPPTS